ncbi:MAG: InlB B-repeat-containing protein [Bacteroidales bacterium]|nr:InlB B-repeat-containing protein [Candidatus Colicola equi]
MKNKIRFLAMMLIGVLLSVNQVWGETATWSGSSMVTGTSTSYADYGTNQNLQDDQNNVWSGRWCYQKPSGGELYQFLQLRAYSNNTDNGNCTRISLPTFDGNIQTIVLDVTANTATEKDGAGSTTAMYLCTAYSKSSLTSILSVEPSSATNTITFDLTSLDTKYTGEGLHICAGGGIRVWGVTVTYGSSITYTDYLTDCATTWDVTIAKNENTWGAVNQASVTGVADQTIVSASSNVLTIGTTKITATPTSQDDQYTYAFDKWTNIPVSGKITEDVTITANFTRTPRTYSVKYNMNGGGWKGGEGVYTYTFGVGIPTLATTVDRIGYSFGGWYDNEELEGSSVTSISTTATGDKQFWAKWNVGWKFMYNGDSYTERTVKSDLTYTVHLDGNTTYWFRFSDGVASYDLPSDGNIMTSSNCTNWNFYRDNNKDCGIATTAPGDYTFRIDDSDAANKLVVSVTYPPSVLVTFDMNGHGANTTTYIAPNTAVAQPSDPSAAGWDFAGWYENASCTGDAFDFNTTLSADKTLYAKWIEARTTLYLDPGVWDADNAKFAVYYFGTAGNGWSDLMTIAPCESSIYTTTIPKGYKSVDFVRLSNDATAGDWGKKWNQTSNITLSDSWDKCSITGWGDNGGDSPCSTSKYSPTTFTVTCAVNPAGYGTVSQASVTSVPCGTSISATGSTLRVGPTAVTATPASPDVQYTYAFDHWDWTGNVTEVTSDITATAHFTHTLNQYTINALELTNCAVAGGSSWPTGKKDYGSSFSTTFVANEGYKLPSKISVTGATYTWSAGTLTITSVTGDVTVSIVAVEKTYVNYRTSCTTVTMVTLAKGEHGTANGSATIKLGTSTFSSWTGVEAAAHFDLIGYYADDIKVIDENGTLVSNVSGWTTADGKWDKDETTATLTAKFTQRTYTVTTSDIDEVTDHVVNEGETYTLPALSCATGDFTRVGWTTTAPTDNAWATRPTITEVGAAVSAAGTYYAVYGEGSGDPNTFVRVNSITDGAYVITSTEESPTIYAMKYTGDNDLGAQVITESSTGVVNASDPMLIWNVTVSGSAISLQTQNTGNKYIGINNEKTAFSRTDNLSRPWTVDWYNGKASLNAGNDGDADVYLNYSKTKFGLDYDYDYNLVFYKQEGAGLDYISNPVCCENKVAAPVVDDATKTHNSITLSWSNVDGATGYKVTINGDTHDVTTSSCSHTESGLEPNTAYSWTVVATWDSEGAYCGAIPANGTTTTNPVYTLTITDTEGVYDIKANKSTKKTQSFAAGTEITLSGTTKRGYIFGKWVVMQGETPISVTNNKFTMPAANVTVTATFTAKKDYYVDDMNDNEQIVMEGQYTVPGLPDVVTPSSNSCEQTHLYFVGWIEGEIDSGQEEEPAGLIRAGADGTANEKTYHAVWAEDANSNQ